MNILDQLEDLERKATKGPWTATVWLQHRQDVLCEAPPESEFADVEARTSIRSVFEYKPPASDESKANSELMGAMRNALPALLRVVRAAWKMTNSVATSPYHENAKAGLRDALAELAKEAT